MKRFQVRRSTLIVCALLVSTGLSFAQVSAPDKEQRRSAERDDSYNYLNGFVELRTLFGLYKTKEALDEFAGSFASLSYGARLQWTPSTLIKEDPSDSVWMKVPGDVAVSLFFDRTETIFENRMTNMHAFGIGFSYQKARASIRVEAGYGITKDFDIGTQEQRARFWNPNMFVLTFVVQAVNVPTFMIGFDSNSQISTIRSGIVLNIGFRQ